MMVDQQVKDVVSQFVQNITAGNDDIRYNFKSIDRGQTLLELDDNRSITFQKRVIVFFVFSSLITSNIDNSRTLMNCVHKIFSPNEWHVKLMLIIVATMQATQFSVNIEIFDAVFNLLHTSTNTVEIIKNSLTAMMLGQLDNIGSQVIYAIFKSAHNDLTKNKEFLSFKSPAVFESPLLLINFLGGIYLARNFVLYNGLDPAIF